MTNNLEINGELLKNKTKQNLRIGLEENAKLIWTLKVCMTSKLKEFMNIKGN